MDTTRSTTRPPERDRAHKRRYIWLFVLHVLFAAAGGIAALAAWVMTAGELRTTSAWNRLIDITPLAWIAILFALIVLQRSGSRRLIGLALVLGWALLAIAAVVVRLTEIQEPIPVTITGTAAPYAKAQPGSNQGVPGQTVSWRGLSVRLVDVASATRLDGLPELDSTQWYLWIELEVTVEPSEIFEHEQRIGTYPRYAAGSFSIYEWRLPGTAPAWIEMDGAWLPGNQVTPTLPVIGETRRLRVLFIVSADRPLVVFFHTGRVNRCTYSLPAGERTCEEVHFSWDLPALWDMPPIQPGQAPAPAAVALWRG